MNFLGAPRQPFVGLAVMAGLGIMLADFFPLFPSARLITAIAIVICAIVVLRWPGLVATYVIVGSGFFLLHNFQTSNTEGQRIAAQLGDRPRVLTATGYVISEPKVTPNGFATFLLKLESIELEDRKQATRAIWQVLWQGFRVPPFAADDLIRQARRYKSRRELTRALRLVARADAQLRSNPPSKRLVLEQLVLELASEPKVETNVWEQQELGV